MRRERAGSRFTVGRRGALALNRPLKLLDTPATRGVDVERRLQFPSQALNLASRIATRLPLPLERRAEMLGFLRRTRGRTALTFERRPRVGEIVVEALKGGSLRGQSRLSVSAACL